MLAPNMTPHIIGVEGIIHVQGGINEVTNDEDIE